MTLPCHLCGGAICLTVLLSLGDTCERCAVMGAVEVGPVDLPRAALPEWPQSLELEPGVGVAEGTP